MKRLKASLLLLMSLSLVTAVSAEEIDFTYSDGEDVLGFIEDSSDKPILNSSDVETAGELADITGDGDLELPFVDTNGNVNITTVSTGETERIAGKEANVAVSTDENKLGVGDWTGNGNNDVLFPNAEDSDQIYVAEYEGVVEEVDESADLAAEAVSDVADFTGNREQDIIFVGTSQELRYYDSETETVESTGVDVGQDQNVGLGPTEDFNDNGEFRTYIVDNSQRISLVNFEGEKEFINDEENVRELPVAAEINSTDALFYYQVGDDVFASDLNGETDEISVNPSTDSEYKYGLLSGEISNIPEPENQEIRIFNVTGQQDKTAGGDLLDQGLNKTFEINQSETQSYRFEFGTLNNGTSTWNLSEEDLLEHRGLNQSWQLSNISYETEREEFEGGEFNSGNVEWDTSLGGEVRPDEELNSEYVAEIDDESTNTYSQDFEADADLGGLDLDRHELEVLVIGFINTTIENPDPDEETVLQNNREFTLNGSVDCLEGDCGEIDSNPLSNGTGFEDSFDVIEQRNECGELFKSERCDVEWGVNATGEADTDHELSIDSASSFEEVENDESDRSLVEIQDILMIDTDFDRIEFGIEDEDGNVGPLDPGTENNSAIRNNQGYNLTVDEDSNTVDNLWIEGSNLLNEEEPDEYQINISDMKYNDTNDVSQAEPITEEPQIIDTDISPGTVKTFYYWLDVPLGILKGGYDGSITFRANQTE